MNNGIILLSQTKKVKMRCILCVRIDLLLDGSTDSHETLGVSIVRPGLLHGVLFDFRSEPPNRKLAVFGNRKLKTSKPEVEKYLIGKLVGFCNESPIFVF